MAGIYWHFGAITAVLIKQWRSINRHSPIRLNDRNTTLGALTCQYPVVRTKNSQFFVTMCAKSVPVYCPLDYLIIRLLRRYLMIIFYGKVRPK